MAMARIVPALAILLCVAAPALAQTPSRSLAARVTTLEKENAALRDDVDRLEKLLTQTRRDMVTVRGGPVGVYVPSPPGAALEPQGLAAQQAQTNAAIQQQGVQQQMNNLQLQQQMLQDRQREQTLFQPQTFGAQP